MLFVGCDPVDKGTRQVRVTNELDRRVVVGFERDGPENVLLLPGGQETLTMPSGSDCTQSALTATARGKTVDTLEPPICDGDHWVIED
jgi:hypothetical protein